jgi:signal transduction histidine kinase
MKIRFKISLRIELIALVVAIIIFVVAVFSYFFISTYKSYFLQTLKLHTKSQAYRLADSLVSSIPLGRSDTIQHYINNVIRESDIVCVEVYDKNFNRLANCQILNKELENFLSSHKLNENIDVLFEKQKSMEYIYEYKGKSGGFEFISPVVSYKSGNVGGEVIGFVRIISSFNSIDRELAKMIRSTISLAAYVIVISVLLSFMAIKLFLEPINKIVNIAKQISQGDLSTKIPIFKFKTAELKTLAISINIMCKHLKNILDILHNEKESLQNAKRSLEIKNKSIKDLISKEHQMYIKLKEEERFYTIGKLVASLAHRIKNPLAGFKNIVYFISKVENFKNEKSKKMLNILAANITKIDNILTELLDYSEISSSLNKLPIYVDDLIRKTIKNYYIPDDISLKTDLEHFCVLVDKENFKKIITPLFINALEAMPFGGEVVISVHKVENTVELKIKDDGCGINNDVVKNIYEPLYTTKARGLNLGLGLSIVKEIVELHNGTINVNSKRGVGTEFTIRIPGR